MALWLVGLLMLGGRTMVMMIRTHIYRGHGWWCPPTAWIKCLMDPCTFIIAIGYDAMMSMICKKFDWAALRKREGKSQRTLCLPACTLCFVSQFNPPTWPLCFTFLYFSPCIVIPQCIVLTSQVSTQEYRRLCRCRGKIQQEGFL